MCNTIITNEETLDTKMNASELPGNFETMFARDYMQSDMFSCPYLQLHTIVSTDRRGVTLFRSTVVICHIL